MDSRFTPLSAKRSAPDPHRPGRFSLHVAWQDGRTSEYPWGYLRALCVCAHCRGRVIESVRGGAAGDAPDGPETRVAGLAHVGHYALGVTWADGHNSIYPWDYLRPCDAGEHGLDAVVAYLETDPRLRGGE